MKKSFARLLMILLFSCLFLLCSSSFAEDQDMAVIDVTVTGSTVTATYITDRTSELVVELGEDSPVILRREVGKGIGEAVFSDVSLPEYFSVKAWLEDPASDDMSDSFTSALYTESIQLMLRKTPDDFQGCPTLQLQGGENAFLAMKEGSKIISTEDMEVSGWGEDLSPETLVISGASQAVKELQAGDEICLADTDDGKYAFMKVESIDIDGDTVTLTGAADYEATDSILHFDSGLLIAEHDIAINIDHTSSNTSDEGHVTLTGKLEVDIAFQIAWDITLKDPNYLFYCKLILQTAGSDGNDQMTATVTGKMDEEIPIPLPGISLVGIPGILEVSPLLKFPITLTDAEGEFDMYFGSSLRLLACPTEKSSEMVNLPPDFQVKSMSGEASLGIYLGLSMTPIQFIAEFDAGNYVAGIVKAKLKGGETTGGSAGDESLHACIRTDNGKEYPNCVCGTFGAAWKYRWKVSLLSVFSYKIDLPLYTKASEKWHWYKSLTFGDGAFNQDCPHWGRKITITVQDGRGKPMAGQTVKVTPAIDHYTCEGTTDSNDQLVLYMPDNEKGRDYRAKTSYDDPDFGTLTAEESFTVSGKAVNVVLTIPNRKTTVRFLDLTSGADPENMPEDIVLREGDTFTIPTQTPTKYGFTFVGWTSDRHGTTPSVEPWQTVTAQGESMIYYALWSRKTYTIHFEGLGGTPVPDDLILYEDESKTVPRIFPKMEGYSFLGWSLEQGAELPDYCAGMKLPVNQNMTLYAVWQMVPVVAVTITYDPNGGTGELPVQYASMGNPCRVTFGQPERQGYSLLGWSTDSAAEMPEYLGGDELIPTSDMTLYAVWQINPLITYTISYDAGRGVGAPDTQYVPDGETVLLSKQIPTYEGHKFAAWQSSENGSLWLPGDWYSRRITTVMTAIWEPDYRIIKGDGSYWRRGSTASLEMLCNGDFDLFTALMVDGEQVPGDGYVVSRGSTLVALTPQWLETLSNGKHTLVFVYEDGESNEATFRIGKLPLTGDSFPLHWLILGMTIALFGGLMARKSLKNAR